MGNLDAIAPDDASRTADDRTMVGDILDHHAIRSDFDVIANVAIPQDFRAGSDGHVIANRGAVSGVGIADSHTLVDPEIFADFPGSYDCTEAMLNIRASRHVRSINSQRWHRCREKFQKTYKQRVSYVNAGKHQRPILRKKRHQIAEIKTTAFFPRSENLQRSQQIFFCTGIPVNQKICTCKPQKVHRYEYIYQQMFHCLTVSSISCCR